MFTTPALVRLNRVSIVGNEAAHGVGVSIEQPDAKDTIEFTNAILDYMFLYRDRFEQFKKRRAGSGN